MSFSNDLFGILRRHWGANPDLIGRTPSQITNEELVRAIEFRGQMLQQFAEEIVTIFARSDQYHMTDPLLIEVTGTNQPYGIGPGVPDRAPCDGYAALHVINYNSQYDEENQLVQGGFAAIFDGVVCIESLIIREKLDDGTTGSHPPTQISSKAELIEGTLNGTFGPGATVNAYYRGYDPGPTVTCVDPEGIYSAALTDAKFKASLDPEGDQYIAVEVEETAASGAAGSYSAGCGIAFSANNTISFMAPDVASTARGLDVLGDNCQLKVAVACGITHSANGITVANSDLAGDGLVAGPQCSLDVDPGCGIEISAGQVAVKNTDLDGNGLAAGTGCLLDINPSCGLQVDATSVSVNRGDLIGNGLIAGAGACDIAVRASCGVNVDATGVYVWPLDLAGLGLTPGGGNCDLDVDVGCGLKIDASKVVLDTAAVVGAGLTADSSCDTTSTLACPICVFTGCGLEIDDMGALTVKTASLAGCGLTTTAPCETYASCSVHVGEGCGIIVKPNTVSVNAEDIAGEFECQTGLVPLCQRQAESCVTCAIKVDTAAYTYVHLHEFTGCDLEIIGDNKLQIKIEFNDVKIIRNCLGDLVGIDETVTGSFTCAVAATTCSTA
jgi:hypothetical protein